MARLEARRFYPDVALRRDWQGSGAVLFRIERSGRLLDATIANSTGHGALDKAALGIVQRAAPFPAIPDSLPDELAITMPVAFLLEHPSGAQP
jgi:TonB family protein